MNNVKVWKNESILNWLKFNSIKAGAMTQVGISYFIVLIILSMLIKKIFDKEEEVNYDDKPLWKLTLEVLLQTAMIVLGNWLSRKIVGKIPYIFEGVNGFSIKHLKERNGVILGAFTLLLFIGQYKDKVVYLVNRYMNLFSK